jgi:hypothetical protein
VGAVDAPVSGGDVGAREGKLVIMCGGDKGDFEMVEPVMKTYGKNVHLNGTAGQGTTHQTRQPNRPRRKHAGPRLRPPLRHKNGPGPAPHNPNHQHRRRQLHRPHQPRPTHGPPQLRPRLLRLALHKGSADSPG